ncbi:PH domain-containing protein [Aeromicrobium sp. A1-2]|uniref:PH domain-containing protein n=1 Tax=Aeromicrobium sp. A1-2 TaxID=2107713 RepID=UPI0020B16452|nr:PH domain-containing protein [Aeromicrobium sp. A1-2]
MFRALLDLILDLLPDHDIESHLLKHPKEHLKGEYPHHPIVYVRPAAEVLGAAAVFVLAVIAPIEVGWLPMLVVFGLLGHAGFLALRDQRDIFVLTDMRVFRVSGIFSTRRATVPINRILDVTVERPLLGRWLRYGHMTFESAAQEQGVRNIRYIGQVDKIDHAIQKVVQEAGLRGRRPARDGSSTNDPVTQQQFLDGQ